jgi:hypothetical protein
MSVSANAYMRLAFYDLLGALFAPSDPEDASLHTDKLFARICDIIKDRFADPDFGPCDVAIEAGISLRLPSEALYGEKLHLQSFHPFGSSGSRCEFVKTPVLYENTPAHQRDRLRQRLWRLY